jgi:hypothetical protein
MSVLRGSLLRGAKKTRVHIHPFRLFFSAAFRVHCSAGWLGLRLSVVFPGIRAQNCGRYVKKRRSFGILAVYRGDDEELEHCGSRFRKKWR